MAHVLMVDSDRRLSPVYAAALLDAGHTVTLRYNTDDADVFLKDRSRSRPDAVTLELLLPHSTPDGLFPFPAELLVEGGEKAVGLQHILQPGLGFYDHIRRVHNYQGLVVMLTNMDSDLMRNSFERDGCVYAVKEQTYPPKLVEIIEKNTCQKTSKGTRFRFLYETVLQWREGRPLWAVRKPSFKSIGI